jgi:hypothetical protein
MAELTYDEFVQRAATLDGLDAALYEDLYPMVRDLLRMAQRVSSLAAGVHGSTDAANLSQDARGAA